MDQINILIVDDEIELRNVLTKLISLEGFKTFEASNLQEAKSIFNDENIDIVITDVRLPDGSGLELIPIFKSKNSTVEIIVLTAYGTIQDGVQAIKVGAFDYITKGDEDNKIIPLLNRAAEKVLTLKKLFRLQQKVSEQFGFANIIGNSTLLKESVEIARKVASTDATVLLTGETGTGKEVFANAIHYSSNRKDNPFVIVNCSAIAKDLLESEMFGYKTGAFTGAVKDKKGLFEEANNGTLFLDEIGEMDISLQAKLLRAIETNSFIKTGDTKPTFVNVRIIAATNKDLEKEIADNKFRNDLYYRISTFTIKLPSLRERADDIPILAESFIGYFSRKLNKKIEYIDPEFLTSLKSYDFPGNIREMKNLIERAVILADSNRIIKTLLPKEFSITSTKSDNLKLEDIEKGHILKVLSSCSGNKTKAAEILGIGLTTLYRKLELYGIDK